MLEILGQVVEKHVPQPAAENDAERDEKQKIGHLFGLPPGPRPSGAHASEQDTRNESGQIHEPVPVYGQRPDGDGNGVEARMGDQDIASVGVGLERRTARDPIIGAQPAPPNTYCRTFGAILLII